MSKLCYEAVVMKTEWWGNFQPGKHYCNNNNNSNKQLRNTVAAWTLSVKLEKSIPYIHTEYAYRQCINIETGRKVNYESIEKNILFSLLLSNTEKRLMHAPGYPRSLPYLHTHTNTHRRHVPKPCIPELTNVCTVVVHAHVCKPTQTDSHHCRTVGRSLKRDDLCAFTQRGKECEKLSD